MGAPCLRSSFLLEDHFAHYSALRDFNEVMPVLLPSHFRPGPAQSSERRLPSEDDGATSPSPDGIHAGIEIVGGASPTPPGEEESLRQPLISAGEEETKDSRMQAGRAVKGSSSPPTTKGAALDAEEAAALLQNPPWRRGSPASV